MQFDIQEQEISLLQEIRFYKRDHRRTKEQYMHFGDLETK